MIPQHLKWSVNNIDYSSLIEQNSLDFKYEININRDDLKNLTPRNAVYDAVRQIKTNKPIALCMSGGIDSTVIAYVLSDLGIPFDMFFLNFWEKNMSEYYDKIRPLEKVINKQTNVITISKEQCMEETIFESFDYMGLDFPTYLIMPHLFKTIGQDYFILCGLGDLDKTGVYKHFAPPNNDDGIELPVNFSEVAWRLFQKKHNQEGQFYFYNSTPDIINSFLSDRDFIYNYPMASHKETVYREFPEIPRRNKNTNWEGHFKENKLVRDRIAEYANKKDLIWWKPLSCWTYKIIIQTLI